MKTFKLNSVKYQNIMSVGSVPIEIDLSGHHKTLITGKNGGGKSTMLEAICFALFGKPFRDLKKNQLINSVNKKGLLVELAMEYDGHKYFIRRGLKPTVFEILRDDVKLDEAASVKDFQEYFEQMIGMSITSFKQTVVLGTAGYVPFMSLKTPERRKLVEDLLGVSILAGMDKLNKAQIRDINQQAQILDLKKDSLQNQITTHEQYAEKQKKAGAENLARYNAMYEQLVAEVLGYKDELIALTEQMTAIVLGDDPSQEFSQLSGQVGTLSSKVADFKRVLHLHEKGGSCPTCMQQIGADEHIKGKIVNIIDESDKRTAALRLQMDEVQVKINEFKAEQQKLIQFRSEIASKKAIAQQTADKARKLKAAIEELSKEVVDNSEEVARLAKELATIVKEKSDLVMEKYCCGIITDMLKDSGIKGSIIKKYIPYFNQRIAHYLKIMEADYSFTLDEEFNETIKSRGREDFSYTSFSQGEKARIDISLLFTWRDVASKVSGVNISALFLDEVFDSATDAEGVKGISTVLNSMTDSNIFIISHRDHDPQAYGQHLKMVKKGRFTEMH